MYQYVDMLGDIQRLNWASERRRQQEPLNLERRCGWNPCGSRMMQWGRGWVTKIYKNILIDGVPRYVLDVRPAEGAVLGNGIPQEDNTWRIATTIEEGKVITTMDEWIWDVIMRSGGACDLKRLNCWKEKSDKLTSCWSLWRVKEVLCRSHVFMLVK